MKLGLIVRIDNRGLGIQTWELYRHLRPYRTVAVRMSGVHGHDRGREFPERFPDALVADYSGSYGHGAREPYATVLEHLRDCDVLLTAETPYDFRLWTDLPATRTVLVGNREFLDWNVDPDLPRPDLFVSPSSWLIHEWPSNTVYLPHPVDRQRLPFRQRVEARRFLHLAAEAFCDRAGTDIVAGASRLIRRDIEIVSRSQRRSSAPRRRHLAVEVADLDNYWDVYRGFDVLLAPRRYGGQSLPVNEALSLGMPVIALDRDPERQMLPPESLVPAKLVRPLRVSGGWVDLWDAQPRQLAEKINEFADDSSLIARLSLDANERAEELSWRRLGPRWRQLLEEV